MKGGRFWMVYHPHGAIVDGAGAKVVLADSESEETLGESFSSSKETIFFKIPQLSILPLSLISCKGHKLRN